MGSLSCRRVVLSWIMPALLLFLLVSAVGAQGLTAFAGQSASPFPSLTGAPPQLIAPSNPLGAPGSASASVGSDCIPLSSGMFSGILPRIPNLELGFLYYFGNRVNTGRFTADYVLPFSLSCDSVLFGEAHAEGWDFWKRPSVSVAAAPGFTVTTSNTNNRVDLSFGGGYRTMLAANTLLGVNGFYDTSRLFNTWYSSGGVGLEFAANVAGDDAIDLNFNWYGNLFNRDVLVNAFRNRGNSFDVETGYSHALFNQALDLRLKLIGYQFDVGTPVRGWRGGADLTTRDGMFSLRYEHGHDRVDGDYNTVGGFVTVGLQLENVLKGESPFTAPEPVFKSPRDLRRLLGLKVKRNWHQPEAVVLARAFPNPPPPPGDVWFSVDCQHSVFSTFTGLPATGSAAALGMNDHTVIYATYSINFVGNTATLPPTVPVTVTWSDTFRNSGFSWGPLGSGNNGTMTLDIPRTGGTIGSGGSVLDTNPENRPHVSNDKDGIQGTVTFEAPGVKTLTITVDGPGH
jgi:hypothetical protein